MASAPPLRLCLYKHKHKIEGIHKQRVRGRKTDLVRGEITTQLDRVVMREQRITFYHKKYPFGRLEERKPSVRVQPKLLKPQIIRHFVLFFLSIFKIRANALSERTERKARPVLWMFSVGRRMESRAGTRRTKTGSKAKRRTRKKQKRNPAGLGHLPYTHHG